MSKPIAEVPYAVIIAGIVLIGLWLSNIVYDLKVPHYISRKIGHAGGGIACLVLLKHNFRKFAGIIVLIGVIYPVLLVLGQYLGEMMVP